MGQHKRKSYQNARMSGHSSSPDTHEIAFKNPDSCFHIIGEVTTVNIPFNTSELSSMKMYGDIDQLVSMVGDCLIKQLFDAMPFAALMYLKHTKTYQATMSNPGQYLWTFFTDNRNGVLARAMGFSTGWNEAIIKQLWSRHKHLFDRKIYHESSRLHNLFDSGMDNHTVDALLKTDLTHLSSMTSTIIVSTTTGTA